MKIYDSGSFRDPSGRVFYYKNNVLREIFSNGLNKFNFLKKNNLLNELIKLTTTNIHCNKKASIKEAFLIQCQGPGFEPATPCSQNIGFLVIF